MQYRSLAFIALLTSITAPVHADTFTPSHYCSAPHKPYQFTSDWEIQQFQDDVEDYKQCINDFVDEQQEAVRKHRRAAEEAIDEWNDFVSRLR